MAQVWDDCVVLIRIRDVSSTVNCFTHVQFSPALKLVMHWCVCFQYNDDKYAILVGAFGPCLNLEAAVQYSAFACVAYLPSWVGFLDPVMNQVSGRSSTVPPANRVHTAVTITTNLLERSTGYARQRPSPPATQVWDCYMSVAYRIGGFWWSRQECDLLDLSVVVCLFVHG